MSMSVVSSPILNTILLGAVLVLLLYMMWKQGLF